MKGNRSQGLTGKADQYFLGWDECTAVRPRVNNICNPLPKSEESFLNLDLMMVHYIARYTRAMIIIHFYNVYRKLRIQQFQGQGEHRLESHLT